MSKKGASTEDTLIALVLMRGWIVKKSTVTAAQLLIPLIKHTGIAMRLMRIVITRLSMHQAGTTATGWT